MYTSAAACTTPPRVCTIVNFRLRDRTAVNNRSSFFSFLMKWSIIRGFPSRFIFPLVLGGEGRPRWGQSLGQEGFFNTHILEDVRASSATNTERESSATGPPRSDQVSPGQNRETYLHSHTSTTCARGISLVNRGRLRFYKPFFSLAFRICLFLLTPIYSIPRRHSWHSDTLLKKNSSL